MFSKDTGFQLALSTVPNQLLTAILGNALDQPGVLVAYIGVLEDGTGGSGIAGTGIPTAISTDIVSMVSISSPSSSSLSLAASSASSPLLPSFSLASPSPGTLSKTVEKRIRSRKGERPQGGKKEWKTGVVEEREERSKEVKCVVEAEGNAAVSGSVSAACRVAGFSLESPGSPVDSEGQNLIATATESAKNLHFRGLSQNMESCGVPARLKPSTLSAHQMPHRHPGSEVQPWIHGYKQAESPTFHW